MQFYEDVQELIKSPDTDPDGSYTGIVTDDCYDIPVQDADDL